jgi:hypothetical protein
MTESRKRKLWLIMFSLMIFGLIAVGRVFVSAWKHPANAGADLIRFDPSKLSDGQFTSITLGEESKLGYKFFLIRDEGKIKIFGFLADDDEFVMLEKNEVQINGHCHNLIFSDKTIHCNDTDIYDNQREYWRWTADGKNISGQIFDLRRIDYSYDGDVITIGKK